MCGIFGYVYRAQNAEDLPDLAAAIRALKHRGPNDEGTFTQRSGDLVCGLAHTRLSILDLSALGHQPMSTKDGRFTLVYNGEIYNFAQVRASLEAIGEIFESNCDTEVLLKAYVRWGADCVQQLQGMFAFGIWDEQNRRLVLARDRLGVKPLYYVHHPGKGIAFASEIRALLATRAAEPRLSLDGVSSYLASGSVRDPHTILRGVSSLPPASVLEFAAGETNVRKYWHPPARGHANVENTAAVAAVERTRTLLERSIRLRLVADVPVGVFLSGGIDSSAITALAARTTGKPVHTFTLSFEEAAWDERQFARTVAERFGCSHHEVSLSADRALNEIDRALAAQDQPSADGINSYFVSKAAREAGLAVALSGVGADEVFGGYDYFRLFAHVWRARRWLGASSVGLAGIGRLAAGRELPQSIRKLVGLTDVGANLTAMYDVIRGMFSPEQRESLFPTHTQRAPEMDEETAALAEALENKRTDSVQAWSILELTNYLPNTLLRDTDAMSMAHGLEVREPFLDHLLIEHVLSLPAAMKVQRGLKKPHLVSAVPELPEEVTRRKKMGFTLPFAPWLRGPLRKWAEERLLDGSVSRSRFLNPDAVDRMWRSFQAGGTSTSDSRIWCLASLLDWVERYHLEA